MASNPVPRLGTCYEANLTDPLIAQARLLNDARYTEQFAAQLERNLAARKALRSDPHARGWMTRRGL